MWFWEPVVTAPAFVVFWLGIWTETQLAVWGMASELQTLKFKSKWWSFVQLTFEKAELPGLKTQANWPQWTLNHINFMHFSIACFFIYLLPLIILFSILITFTSDNSVFNFILNINSVFNLSFTSDNSVFSINLLPLTILCVSLWRDWMSSFFTLGWEDLLFFSFFAAPWK